jgi:hypothetical protein
MDGDAALQRFSLLEAKACPETRREYAPHSKDQLEAKPIALAMRCQRPRAIASRK